MEEAMAAVKENLELKEYIRELERSNDTLRYLNDGLSTDKEELKYRYEEILKDLTEISEKTVPKSRIKKKIEELENENYQISLGSEVAFDTEIFKNNLKIRVLKELIEEQE